MWNVLTGEMNFFLYYTHFEITGSPCNLIGSIWFDLFTNRTIFCFKSHLFPSQWQGYTKNKTTNQISRLVKSNQSNCRKMKDKEYCMENFAKWIDSISNRLSTASIKYLNCPSAVFEWFQNGCNNHTCDLELNWRCALVQFWNHA